MAKERILDWALFDAATPETLANLLNGRNVNLGVLFMGTDGTKVYPIKTDASGNLTASISGDINIDETTPSNDGYKGKASGTNADFTVAYGSATTITCSSLPSGVTAIGADDIFTIVQIAADGSVTAIYSRDDATITASGTDPSTITVAGASFESDDTFIVYTNISKPSSGESEGTPNEVASAKVVQLGGIAETTVPDAVSDGDAVALWIDENGLLHIYGANRSIGAIDTNEVAPALTMTAEGTDLNAVTATGAGSGFNCSDYHHCTVQITASSVTTGGTLKLQGSLDGTEWYDIVATISVTADGNQYVAVSSEKHKFIRTNLTARTDGTYTTKYFLGN